MTDRNLTVAVVIAIFGVLAALGADETRLQGFCSRHASPAACRQW